MFRVRKITDPLVPLFNKIVEDGLLPQNIHSALKCSKNIKYPPFVYNLLKTHKWAFCHFGIFMEKLLQEMNNNEKWKDNIYKIYINTSLCFTEDNISPIVSEKDVYESIGRFVNISKYFIDFAKEKEITYDLEYKCENISLMGHPDLVINGGFEIYDIKTTTKFDGVKMKHGALLQICAYLALARASGIHPTKIGIILPLQQITLTYDLEKIDYDHKPFLEFLLGCIQPRLHTTNEKLEMMAWTGIIGNHINKIDKSVYKSLLKFYVHETYSRPCQLFLRGNRGARSITLTDEDIVQSLSYVFQHNIKFFVHSPYTINLCYPCGRKTKTELPWATNILREDLKWTKIAGGKGVVVHTGKGMGMSDKDAYDAMYTSILSVLDEASEECPLLLETPCDKGTELCGTVESLAEFYLRFSSEERKRFKICVDTCHVFAADYLPSIYLENFTSFSEKIGIESIALIHLNDAQWGKGSCHDGHAWPGTGCIGLGEMLKTIRWCSSHKIPMVNE